MHPIAAVAFVAVLAVAVGLACGDATGPEDTPPDYLDNSFIFEQVEGVPTSANMQGIWSDGSTVVLAGERTILRSEDGGESWVEIWPESGIESLRGVWGADSVVLAVGRGGAIMRSTDQGATWVTVQVDDAYHLGGVWGDGATVVAIGQNRSPLSGRIVRSTDAGVTWSPVGVFPEVRTINGVWGEGETWVAVGYRGAILRSTTGGESWAIARPAGETIESRNLLAVWGRGPTVVATGEDGLILRSVDAGETWAEVRGPAPDVPSGPQLYGVWGDETVVVAAGTHGTILRSIDGGERWETLSGGVFTWEWPGIGFTAIWSDGSEVLALANPPNGAPSGPTVLRSTDRGETWEAVLREAPFLDGVRAEGSLVMGVGRAGAIARSTDGGATWARLDGWMRDEDSPLLWDVWCAGWRAVAVGAEGAIQRSTDGGMSWEAIAGQDASLYGVWGEGSRVVAVGAETILRSTDGGATWTGVASPADVGLLAVWGEGSLVVAVGQRHTEYPATAALFRSTDGGATWTEVTSPSPQPLVAVWGRGSTVVALTGGVGGQILRSTNSGASWEVVEGVPEVDQLVDVTGMGPTLVAVSFDAVLVSNDVGATWSLEPSAATGAMMAVAMPDPRTVVAGGGGIIRGRR